MLFTLMLLRQGCPPYCHLYFCLYSISFSLFLPLHFLSCQLHSRHIYIYISFALSPILAVSFSLISLLPCFSSFNLSFFLICCPSISISLSLALSPFPLYIYLSPSISLLSLFPLLLIPLSPLLPTYLILCLSLSLSVSISLCSLSSWLPDPAVTALLMRYLGRFHTRGFFPCLPALRENDPPS